MIKAILYDVGGTLIHPYPSVGEIYAAEARLYGINADPKDLQKRFFKEFEKHRDSQLILNKALWHRLVRALFPDLVLAEFNEMFESIYNRFESPSAWKLTEGVLDVLNDFKKKNLIQVVASNWDERLPDLLEKLKLTPYFDHLFYSHAMQVQKPDPRFFNHILATLQLKPEEVLHVGDDLHLDIEPAKKLGLETFHVTNTNPLKKLQFQFTAGSRLSPG